MGDIARCSAGGPADFYNEALLYQMFGVNAELLIDHAWGWEPCTIADIKAYRPETSSISSGQVLQQPYPFEKARLVLSEMADLLALAARLDEQPEARITYFQPDARKAGGAYCTVAGRVKNIDLYTREVVLASGQRIAIDEIVQVV